MRNPSCTMSRGRPVCHSVAQNWPRVPPRLAQHPIGQGGHYIRHSFSRPAAVSGSAPLVLGVDSSWTTWTVDTGYVSRHRFPPAPTGPSTNPRGWYGAGLSGVPPWGDSRVRAPRRSSPWTSSRVLLAYSDCCGILLR